MSTPPPTPLSAALFASITADTAVHRISALRWKALRGLPWLMSYVFTAVDSRFKAEDNAEYQTLRAQIAWDVPTSLTSLWWQRLSKRRLMAAARALLRFSQDVSSVLSTVAAAPEPAKPAKTSFTDALNHVTYDLQLLVGLISEELCDLLERCRTKDEPWINQLLVFLQALFTASATALASLVTVSSARDTRGSDRTKSEARTHALLRVLVDQGSTVLAALLEVLPRLQEFQLHDPPEKNVHTLGVSWRGTHTCAWLCARQMLRSLSPYLYRCVPLHPLPSQSSRIETTGSLSPLPFLGNPTHEEEEGQLSAELHLVCWTNPLLLSFAQAELRRVTEMDSTTSATPVSVIGSMLPLAILLVDSMLRDVPTLRALKRQHTDPSSVVALIVTGAALPDTGVELSTLVATVLDREPLLCSLSRHDITSLQQFMARCERYNGP